MVAKMTKIFASYVFIIAIAIGIASIRKQCNFRPGLNKMKKGVDITKLDYLPLNQNEDDGFRLSVIKFTCEKPKKRSCMATSYGRTVQKEKYDIPDQATNLYVNPTGTLSSSTQIYKSSNDYKKTMAASASVDYGFGVFSASASYKKIENSIQKEKNFVQESYVHVSAFNVDLNVPLRLPFSADAKIYVDKLPSIMNTDNFEEFLDFYKKFGTHFMQSGKFGGSIRFFIETKQSYYKERSDNEIRAEVGGTVAGFTGSASFGYDNSDSNDEFQKNSKKIISYYGGVTNLLANGSGLSKWQPTVGDRPMLFTATLVPIYELVQDDLRKKQLEKAYYVYLARHELEDVEKKLELVKLGFGQDLEKYYNSFFKEIEEEVLNLKKKMVSRKEVIKVGKDVKEKIKTTCNNNAFKSLIKTVVSMNKEGQSTDGLITKDLITSCEEVLGKQFE